MAADRSKEAIERRLGADEWLRPGEVAILFDASRASVDRWIKLGVKVGGKRLRIRYRVTPGGHRLCDPADVRHLLAETRRVRGGDGESSQG